MENAVVYARYSSHNQSEQSIEGQVTAAEKYAKDHDLNIIHVYADRAKTGTNDQREAFQQMLSDCKKHTFTVIIVWKVDRFGRNREEITFNKYKCKKEGVRVEYVAENLGESNEAVILESVLEGMAEYYSKQLSTNVRRGQAEARKKGHYIGYVPMGFKRVNKGLVVDEESAELVRTVFKRYLDGESAHKIADGDDSFKHRIYFMLQNDVYRGTIVNEMMFDDAKAKYLAQHKRRRTTEELKGDYILTTKLFCDCGGSMTGNLSISHKNGKTYTYSYYRCNRCGRLIRKEVIESNVLQVVHANLTDDKIDRIADNALKKYKEREQAKKKSVCSYEAKLKKLSKSIDNIYKAIEDGMPYAQVKERLDNLEAERNELLMQKNVDVSPETITKEKIVKYLSSGKGLKNDLRTIDFYVSRIDVKEDGLLDIQLIFMPNSCIKSDYSGLIRLNARI